MKTPFAFLLAAVLLVASTVQAQQLQPVDRIAAVVNDDIILQSELDRAVANIQAQYAGRQDQLPPLDVLQRQVLERLILMRLQMAKAADSGIQVGDDEVDSAIGRVADQNHMSVDQLRAQVTRGGGTWADFRNSLHDELVVQHLRQAFAQTISVSDAEVDSAIAAQANSGEQYHLAHILVALPDGATPDQIAKGQEKIDGIKQLIDSGKMEFNAAAVRYSDSPNALEGGDLGWRSVDEIPTSFANSIRTLQSGQVIGPIRGPSGFQLLKLLETRDASQAPTRMVTQYQARHILIRPGPNLTDDQAKAKIDTLRARIAGGADFAALAKENSDDTVTAAKGGELGWFSQDQFGPDFGAQVAALQDGQVSQAFKSQAGWHIVQREASRQADVGKDDQRAQAREAIGQRKLDDAWERTLRDMRSEAYVDIRSGAGANSDSSAAAPSPAPADSATTQPAPQTPPSSN